MNIDFTKGNGLVPVIVQDSSTKRVLMLGYMNAEAVEVTITSKRVTFFSRSKGRLWTKGESSGHYLHFQSMHGDCDNDALLIFAIPEGPTCHTGAESCFDGTMIAESAASTTGPSAESLSTSRDHRSDKKNLPTAGSESSLHFLKTLEDLIQVRRTTLPEGSYVTKLFKKGRQKIAQKVGEEAVELVLETHGTDEKFHEEAADLLFHYLVLLAERGSSLDTVLSVLKGRHVPS